MELVTYPGRIVVVGEGMIELSGDGSIARLGHGGDTLNTAIHLARFALPTSFFTALGRDPFSERLRAAWSSDGLDASLILTDPDRNPGLYAIHTDSNGERSFVYWRGQSAARRMFELAGASEALRQAEHASLLYFSLVSLAILPPSGREQLLDLARRVSERGGQVAFDGNYRPQLWRHRTEARRFRDEAVRCCTIGLPGLEDERSLSDLPSGKLIYDRWKSLGPSEVIVKLDSAGAFTGDSIISPPASLRPVDTTGAGDAFNAGYLAARMGGAKVADAVSLGHRLAGWVIMRRGAVPSLDDDAPYFNPATQS